MAKIVTLKKNDEYVYPVTTGEAVIGAVYTEEPGEDEPAQPWVTSDMIDWDTVTYKQDTVFKSGAQLTIGTTKTGFATLTIPTDGVYLIALSFDINANGYYLADSNINITAGSASLVDRYINNNAKDYWLGGINITITASLTAGTVVTASGKAAQNSFIIPAGESRRHFSATRIA